jgi:hypothetical protein
MQGLVKRAKAHLYRNNMTYSEHFLFAFRYGLQCIKAGIFLCTHSILPCFFERAGSRLVHKLEKVFVERETEKIQ